MYSSVVTLFRSIQKRTLNVGVFIFVFANSIFAQIPSITSFAPTSGAPGSIVVITGTNFNTIAANNAVFFTGARGTVTAASATQLTVTVPAGARSGFIDVVNLGSFRQRKSFQQFIVKFNGSGFSATSFGSPVNFSTGGTTNNPRQLELADMDNDGKLDIVVSRAGTNIGTLRNTATTNTPAFASVGGWSNINGTQGYAIADLNSDGKLDIFQTANITSLGQNGSAAPNNSTVGNIIAGGAVVSGATPANNQTMRGAAIADVSSPADGRPDALWTFESSGGINNSFLYANVNSGASPALVFASGVVLLSSGGFYRMWNAASADFDGDGLNDVASYETNVPAPRLLINRNTTAGFTNSYYTLALGTSSPQAGRLSVFDVDADGKSDLVLLVGTNQCRVYRNTSTTGALSFVYAGDFGATLADRNYFTMGDVTGDGKLDLVIACNNTSGSIAVLPNTTTGSTISFGTAVTFAGQAATDVAVGDVNSDGKPDIVAISSVNSNANIYINNTSSAPITPAPTITSFTPTSGLVGTSVTITGNHFTATSAVSFNNVAASSFTVNSATQITATVATGTTTGAVRVTTPGGTATSATNFTVNTTPPPTITGFTPFGGPVGTVVTITGTDFTNANTVAFNSTPAASYTVNSATQITATVGAGSTTGPIRVTTPSGTVLSTTDFLVGVQPTITSFTPTSGPVGTVVTINGTNFTGAQSASFNNTTSDNFSIINATQVTARVAPGSTTGRIRVTGFSVFAISATDFTVTAPTAAPTIASFTPSSGPVGTSVTITGTNFTNATGVSFNNVAAASFVVNSATQITATVAAGSSTGAIRVTTAGGTATSATNFTVSAAAPTITSFTPSSGSVGTTVLISGTNFSNASAVSFNNVSATGFLVNPAATLIQVNVPAGATTGAIRVTTPGGTVTSSTNFTVAASNTPVITSIDNNVYTGFEIFISGQNLANPTSVTCGGIPVPLANIVVSAPNVIRLIVPATWPMGTNPVVVTTANGTSNSVSLTITHYVENYRPGGGVYSGFVVAMNGTRLSTVSAVTIGGMAASFTVVSDTRINVTVPNFGTALGDKVVTTTTPLGGTVSGPFPLRVFAATGPIITAISPLSGPVGSVVAIDGFNLNTVTTVRIGNVTLPAGTFTIVNANRINATVPPNAQSGFSVGVINPTTGNVSDEVFTVTAPLITINNVDILSAPANATITITGNNLTGAQVAVSQIPLNVLSNNGTTMTVQAPSFAWSGPIIVTSPAGTELQAGFFTHQTASRVLYHRAASVLTLTGPSGAFSYQWQVNQGAGFNNLSNGGVYAGVNTRSLIVNNIPTSASGFQYRVLINGSSPQPAFTLRFVTYAKNNGMWNNAATWEGDIVPDINTDVIVNDASVNLNVSASIRTLLVTEGGQVQVFNNQTLTIRQ